jgi:phospholipid/cholesterol/gamma-HCH transport system substrate-binding protein
VRPFFAKNREVLTHDINNLADVTTTLVQPKSLNGLENLLHAAPTGVANINSIYHPSHGAIVAIPAIANFANPMQFICSTIQAGSRLGYQESAELCAQYLGPILDAIKFNYLPFGLNLFSTAETTPKEVAYSEPRLQPPDGYKDTTVPGIWVPDTPTSHKNTQPGWITAPGMPVQSNLQTPPGYPNAYDEQPGPLPYMGQPDHPAPIQPPPPGPDVRPGPVPPTPAGPAPGPAPAGPLLPAEMGAGQ